MNNYSRFITVKKVSQISVGKNSELKCAEAAAGAAVCTAKETIREKRTKVEIKVNFG